MQCNIDARGKAFRLISGVVLAIVGLIAIGLHAFDMLPIDWSMLGLGFGVGLVLTGAFCIFEGWAGWCAVRAMGFKTRL